jgi:hypothetical protein
MKQGSGFSKRAQDLDIESVRLETAATRRGTVFVIFGSRAWAKWMEARAAQGLGMAPTIWNPQRQRKGWYFSTLFPAAADFAPRKHELTAAEAESMARLAALPKP